MDNVAALVSAIESRDKRAIRAAVDAVISQANQSTEIPSRLNELLKERQSVECWPIAYVLANLPDPSERTIQVLVDTLAVKDSDIRWAIVLMLVQLARKDETITTRLLEVVSAGTPTQRRMAVYCIRDLKLSDPSSLRALLDSLGDSDPLVRVAAVTSLKTRSDAGSMGENQLLRLFFKDPDSRVQNAALITLAQLGASSKEFESVLAKAGSTPNPQLRKTAAQALVLLQKKRSAPSGR